MPDFGQLLDRHVHHAALIERDLGLAAVDRVRVPSDFALGQHDPRRGALRLCRLGDARDAHEQHIALAVDLLVSHLIPPEVTRPALQPHEAGALDSPSSRLPGWSARTRHTQRGTY